MGRIEERNEARRQEIQAHRAGTRAYLNDEERKKGALKLLAIISDEIESIRNNRDLKKCEERLMSLDRILSTGELSVPKQKLQNMRLELAAREKERKQTRPKFRFVRNKNNQESQENIVSSPKTSDLNSSNLQKISLENQYIINSVSDTYSFAENSDVLITGIDSTENAVIDISSIKCSTLHVKKVTGIIIKAQVDTSIFIDEL